MKCTCTDGWIPGYAKYYKKSTDVADHPTAQSNCQAMGGMLAEPMTKTEQNDVFLVASPVASSVHLGFQDTASGK